MTQKQFFSKPIKTTRKVMKLFKHSETKQTLDIQSGKLIEITKTKNNLKVITILGHSVIYLQNFCFYFDVKSSRETRRLLYKFLKWVY